MSTSVIYLKPSSHNYLYYLNFSVPTGETFHKVVIHNSIRSPVWVAIKVLIDVDKKSMVQYIKKFHLKHPVGIMLRLTFKTSVKIMRTDKQRKTLMAWIPATRKVTVVFLF